jgi:hypothetical protein
MVEPDGDIDQAYHFLVPAAQYLESLRTLEGYKNPEGVKGGVSGICKAFLFRHRTAENKSAIIWQNLEKLLFARTFSAL